MLYSYLGISISFPPFLLEFIVWRYTQHGQSPLSQLLISAHSHSIVYWFFSSHFMFHKYTTDITYITESGRKKNKQERTWVSPKRKKREVLAIFWYSVAIASVYLNEILTQLPGTLTHPLALVDLASRSTGPNSLLSHNYLSLQVCFIQEIVPLNRVYRQVKWKVGEEVIFLHLTPYPTATRTRAHTHTHTVIEHMYI